MIAEQDSRWSAWVFCWRRIKLTKQWSWCRPSTYTGYPPPYFSLAWAWSDVRPASWIREAGRRIDLSVLNLIWIVNKKMSNLTAYSEIIPCRIHCWTANLTIDILLYKPAVKVFDLVWNIDIVEYRCCDDVCIRDCDPVSEIGGYVQYLDVCFAQVWSRWAGYIRPMQNPSPNISSIVMKSEEVMMYGDDIRLWKVEAVVDSSEVGRRLSVSSTQTGW